MTHYYYDTTNQPPPTSVVGDHAVDLSAGDSLILAAGAVIRASGSGADGINSVGGPINLAIQGSVVGASYGIRIGAGSRIQVESTGLVSGSNGMFVSGDNATINNKGLIQGNTGLQLSGGVNVVENSGTIWGTGSGISSLGGSLTLLNRGEVFGGVLAIEGSGQRDVITNLGSIRGNFLLPNDGDDLYDGTGGYCSSLIWLGNGDDIALGGDGSERFYGGGGNDYIDGGAGSDTFESLALPH